MQGNNIVKSEYLELTRLIERLHRRFLDVLRTELNRLGIKDVNPVQALLLVNVGGEEIVIRDLIERGYYQGSNVSYNIKKLTEAGYLEQERSPHDRRSVTVRLTAKALAVVKSIGDLEDRQSTALADEMDAPEVKAASRSLRRLERTWTDYIRDGGR
jgi:DNA-binding MarR family transcriptional regulator